MFGISAPHMSVRAAVPWYWRWLGLLALGIAVLLASRFAYDFGKRFAGFDQSEAENTQQRLATSNSRLQQEADKARGDAAQWERQLQIERATYAEIVKQLKALSDENARLKEDLAFFETLMPAGGKDGAVAVNRFIVQNDMLPGEYRYRLLLTQTGQRNKEFNGNLQFVVIFQNDGKTLALTLPSENEKDSRAYKLNFRFYQRIEGTFRVPAGAAVKTLQVRVFESGIKEPRLTRTANTS